MSRHPLSAFVAASLLLLLSTVSALGHAELEESDPADGEMIETPYTLSATFSTDLDPEPARSFIFIRNSSGTEVARGGVTQDDPTVMTVDLPALPPGEYRARWQAYDPSDDHIELGTINFNVGARATPSPPATPSPTHAVAPTTAASPSPVATTATTPTPTVTPIVNDGQPTTGMNDALLAIALAVISIGAIALFLFARSRR